MEQTERLIKIIVNELSSVCYTCSTGTRWHDIGLKDKFRKALEYILTPYARDFELKVSEHDISHSGTPGNVAGSTEEWSLEAKIKGETLVFHGSWHQTGGAEIRINGKMFLKATEKYGLHNLLMTVEGLSTLESTLIP